jgi:DNA-binding transcriptional LysR family regulator
LEVILAWSGSSRAAIALIEASVIPELRELKWAVIASQHRSLRPAAERLNVWQSTLSRRLCELELHLGTTLFDRTNGGTRPTPAGIEFLETARRIIEDTEAAVSRLRTHGRRESGD